MGRCEVAGCSPRGLMAQLACVGATLLAVSAKAETVSGRPRGALMRSLNAEAVPVKQHEAPSSLLQLDDEQDAERVDGKGFSFRCTPPLPNSGDAWPGTPQVDGLDSVVSSLMAYDAKIGALGDRLLAAADASEAASACGSYFNFGDYTWCSRAMPADTDFAKKNVYGGNVCSVIGTHGGAAFVDEGTAGRSRVASTGQYRALSYGIEETDPWSELMASMYFVSPRLFDCYVQSKKGPMFNDMHGTHSKDNQCTTRNCYSLGYETNRICLEDQESTRDNRSYQTLHGHLEGAAPLSAFVKMDVEGSEWRVLDQLLKNKEDMDRIRTLDMETHLFFNVNDGVPLTRRVEIMEEMAKAFAVTGSSLEPLHRNAKRDVERELAKDPNFRRNTAIYTSSGYPLDQYTISFVNRRLLHDTNAI